MHQQIISAVREHRIIAIMRGVPVHRTLPAAQALYEGGIRLLEVTFNQSSPTKIEDTAQAIRLVAQQMQGKLLVGAGTVMSVEEARAAHEAGAAFVLAPDTNPEVIGGAISLGMVAIPGALTPTEVARAYACGAAMVKLFPAGDLGVKYLKSIVAPLSHIPILAVGGVTADNIVDYLKAGACGAGIGSNIVNNSLIEQERYEELTALARRYTDAVHAL